MTQTQTTALDIVDNQAWFTLTALVILAYGGSFGM